MSIKRTPAKYIRRHFPYLLSATRRAVGLLLIRLTAREISSCRGWEELIYRELYLSEKVAGTVFTRAHTFLFGHTEIIGRYENLRITFKAYYRELTEGYKKVLAAAVYHKLIIKELLYALWHITELRTVTLAFG